MADEELMTGADYVITMMHEVGCICSADDVTQERADVVLGDTQHAYIQMHFSIKHQPGCPVGQMPTSGLN